MHRYRKFSLAFAISVGLSACVSGQGQTVPPVAGWHVTEEAGELPDFPSVMFMQYGDRDNQFPGLVVTCVDNGTVILVNWGDDATVQTIGEREAVVRYQLDSDPAIDTTWEVTSSRNSTGLQQEPAVVLLRQLSRSDARRLAVSAQLADGPVSATFDISRIRDVVSTVSERCGWSVEAI